MEQFVFSDENVSIGPDGKRLVTMEGEENFHMVRVLRVKTGEKVLATDGLGRTFLCVLKEVRREFSVCEVIDESRDLNASRLKYSIGLAVLKPVSKLEWALEKCTELGARQFLLFYSERSERTNLRIERLRNIAVSAMKQSLQSHFPEIVLAGSLADVVARSADYNVKFVFHEKSDCLLAGGLPHDSDVDKWTVALIGPEGGFTEREVAALAERGYEPRSLGSARLRSETAAVKVASLLSTY